MENPVPKEGDIRVQVGEREFSRSVSFILKGIGVFTSVFYIYSTIFGIFTIQVHRGLYIGILLLLVYVLYPLRKASRSSRLFLAFDIVLALLSVTCVIYFLANFTGFVGRVGNPKPIDIWLGMLMMALILEAARRSIGWQVPVVGLLFLMYAWALGRYMPGLLYHRGVTIERIASTMYMSLEGIFGIITGIMVTTIFIFIIFGAFIRKTGLEEVFQQLPLALVGHLRGGPAQVAVLSSALFGSISGSAVANVSATGIITIPLMKRMGYSPHVAGGIETVASVGGQLMPPIIGAAVFLMAEFLGIPYATVVLYSLFPAFLYFFAVSLSVYFEAHIQGVEKISREELPTAREVLRKGWPYFLPILTIIAFLTAGYSPELGGACAIFVTIGIKSLQDRRLDFPFIFERLAQGTFASLGIGAAIAVMGIIIGSVNLTGLGLKATNLVISISGGNLIVLLALVAFVSLVLGMALPTTAAYIVVSALAVPAIIEFGIPALAAHLIILWLSQDSNITPPVAVAAYVAASIADASPWRTGWASFRYGKMLYLGPLFFALTPILMLDSVPEGLIFAVSRGIPVIILLTAALAGWWGIRLWIPLRALFIIFCYFILFGQGYQTLISMLLAIAISIWTWRQRAKPNDRLEAPGTK